MAERYSNTDIMQALSSMLATQGRIEEKVDVVARQAEKTNGRVNTIEMWMNGIQAIDKYKKENPTQTINAPNATTVIVPPKWFQNDKLVGAVVAVLLAIAAVLAYFAGAPR